MSHYSLFSSIGGLSMTPVASVGAFQSELQRSAPGTRGQVQKHCGMRHRRHPGQIINTDYTVVLVIKYCPVCGLIQAKNKLVVAKRVTNWELHQTGVARICMSEKCQEYQDLLQTKPKRAYDMCTTCGKRTAVKGHPCPMCGGPELYQNELPTFSTWAGPYRGGANWEFVDDMGQRCYCPTYDDWWKLVPFEDGAVVPQEHRAEWESWIHQSVELEGISEYESTL